MEYAVEGDDGLLDGEDEQPPHDDKQAEEDIPQAGHHRRHDEDDQGDVRDYFVGQFRHLGIFAASVRLPEHAHYEYRREQHVHHGIGDEHDAEADCHEAYHYRRHVKPYAIAYPGGPQTDEERQEDGHQHPAEQQEELGSLHDEIVRGHTRYDGYGYKEQRSAAQ